MLLVGTSGWQYRDWRGPFYPSGVPARRWLEHYAARFRTVEVNNTFYRLPPAETFTAWRRTVPDDFVMALKLSRYLTHYKQLREPAEPVERFLRHAAPLGPRVGPLLLQLPPTLVADRSRLADTLDRFPVSLRVAVEFRHSSWFDDDTLSLLASRNVALVLADRRSRPLGLVERTADWGYVRFHEGRGRPWPCYGDQALSRWAERLAARWSPEEDIFAFFNNDPGGCAVRNACRFAVLARRHGLQPTRVPGEGEPPSRPGRSVLGPGA